MVALETDDLARPVLGQSDEVIHDRPAVGSSINIISEEYELGPILTGICRARRQQRFQLGIASVDVAYGKSQHHYPSR
jgi:hypothetical protein